MEVFNFFTESKGHAARIQELLGELPAFMVPGRVVAAWEAGGLLSPGWSPEGTLTRTWLNVVAHNVAVAVAAYRLSEGDPIVTEAALVHDAYKRREWEAGEQAKKDGVDRAHANRQAELASGTFLADLGFSPEVMRIAGMTGDLGLDRIIAGEFDDQAKLMHYADDCVSGDKLVGYKPRFDALEKEFLPGGRYEFANASCLKKYGKAHRELWDSVIIPLEQKLAEKLHFEGHPSDLYTLAL